MKALRESLILWCWIPFLFCGAEARAGWELESGMLLSAPTERLEPDSSWKRFYLLPKGEYALDSADGTSWSFKAAARGLLEQDARVELRVLSASLSRSRVKATLGFQEISWGETFGVQIADVVNPRDFRDPLLANDLSWVRLPVFALNTQLFLDQLTLQGIFTPVPRNPEIPGVSSSLSEFGVEGIGTDSEYGGRASYLFDFGLDLGAIYYRHWNRNPSLLDAAHAQVDTFGLTASQAVGSFVFRADTVLNQGSPVLADQWRAVVGADVSLENDLTLGLQFQTDEMESEFLNWTSFLARSRFWDGKLEPELVVFHGLNNPDLWIQPKLNWNMTNAISLALRADLLSVSEVPGDGALWMLQGRSRWMSWLTVRF